MNTIEIVFARIYAQQKSRMKDEPDAAIVSIIYMAVGPMLVFFLIDVCTAHVLGQRPLLDIFGKWLYVSVLYGASLLIHWWYLLKDGRAESLLRGYAQRKRSGRFEALTAIIYVGGPMVLATVVATLMSVEGSS